MKIFLLSTVLIFGDLLTDLQNLAKQAFDKAEQVILKIIPDDTPVVKECPCEGKGYIIHGDGHKTACPGTDDGPCKFAKTEAPKKEHGLIIMYSRPGCIYCEQFKKSDTLKGMLKVGWKFKEVPADPTKAVPYFDVVMKGEYNRTDVMNFDVLRKINNKYKGK